MSYLYKKIMSASYLSVNLQSKITAKLPFSSHYVFQDLSTGRRIDSGRERGGMPYLDDKVTPTGLLADQPDPVLLWHCHLDHPSVQKLIFIIPVASFISLGCASCELGKHHRSTYPNRVTSRSRFPFELVHSDVLGPNGVPSIKSFRYFMLLLMISLA